MRRAGAAYSVLCARDGNDACADSMVSTTRRRGQAWRDDGDVQAEKINTIVIMLRWAGGGWVRATSSQAVSPLPAALQILSGAHPLGKEQPTLPIPALEWTKRSWIRPRR